MLASTHDPFLGHDYCRHVMSTLSTDKSGSQLITSDQKLKTLQTSPYEQGHVISLEKGGHVGFVKHNDLVCESVLDMMTKNSQSLTETENDRETSGLTESMSIKNE